MRAAGALVALAVCVGAVLTGAAAGSEQSMNAVPRCVSFLATYTISPDGATGRGTYTRIGPIPAGRMTDRAQLVSEKPFRVRIERTLDPGAKGGPTIRMRLNGVGTAMDTGSPSHNEARGTWSIVSGAGRFGSLSGKGQFVSLAVPGRRGFAAREAFVGGITP